MGKFSQNQQDNEKRKFKADENGETAVNICGEQLQDIVELLEQNGLIWTKSSVTIPASSTVIVDNNLLSSFSRLKYIINFKGQTSDETKGFELTVQNDGGNISDTVSVRLGGNLNIQTNATDDNIDMFLEIVNNESEDLTLTFIKNIL